MPLYMYQDTATLSGFGRNKVVSKIIQYAWFKGSYMEGVKYVEFFAPIREVTLALIYTVVSPYTASKNWSHHIHTLSNRCIIGLCALVPRMMRL